MDLLSTNQLRIITKLAERSRSLSELSLPLKKASVLRELQAIEAAGIPLVLESDMVRLADKDLLLDKEKIELLLNHKSRQIFTPRKLHVLMSVSSTNDEIKQYPAPCVVLAEQQELGKGRYGRSWSSPFAAGIYLSFKWRLKEQNIDGLSLAIGVAVARLLAPIPIGLKWPNDLMATGGKLGGILIELSDQDLIIGARY